MALIKQCIQTTLKTLRARSYCSTFHDSVEHATGLEKREILAHLAGDCDPYHLLMLKRGPGTKEKPNNIPSAFPQRIMGCVCYEDSQHISYMWLHVGVPKRCYCGYWFQLCPVPPL